MPPTARRSAGRRTRLHTALLAAVFALLAIVAADSTANRPAEHAALPRVVQPPFETAP